ncbi:hypothetical protein [Kocuria arenosa]|uniref:hypothetical protein n=1 Tax=Kocuria arenosa TaxID=3071446 RepID=UPI0034D70A70
MSIVARQDVHDPKAAAVDAGTASAKSDYTRCTGPDTSGTLFSKALGREVRYSTDNERIILEQSNELQDVIEANDARLNRNRSRFGR